MALVLLSCAKPETPRPPFPRCGAGDPAIGQQCWILETTNPTIATWDVGLGNVFERDIAGANRPSAMVATHDPATGKEDHRTVIVGSILPIGAQKYQVTAIDMGSRAPGSITIKRIDP